MKKTISFLLCLVFCLGIFSSCGGAKTTVMVAPESSPSDTDSVVTFNPPSVPVSTPVQTGSTVPTPPASPTEPTTEPSETSETTTVPPTDIPRPEDGWLLHETADAGMEYQNALTFLGDSTTYGMLPYEALPGGKENKQVWKGAVGNTITFLYVETVKILYPETGEELTIKEAARKAQPEYLVITLGVTGGVSQNLSEEDFKRLYRTVVDGILEVSPDTKIILQSILPVTKVNQYEKTITNDKIIPFNGWVADLAKEYYTAEKNAYYADTFSALVDEEGYMCAEYGSGDGLHPCLAGYQAILRYLRTHALTLQ